MLTKLLVQIMLIMTTSLLLAITEHVTCNLWFLVNVRHQKIYSILKNITLDTRIRHQQEDEENIEFF